MNGLRTRKNKPDGTSIDYYIVDGQTIAERWNYANGSEYFTMRYVFDQNGSIIGFCTHYPGFQEGYFEHYLFAKNLQGDVVAMYMVGSGLTLIATYEYDSWGRVLSVKDANGSEITNPSHLALRQPFRYRGYHYDTETGYYYLRSRYYDPEISRFINADAYASTGQGFLGCNMFGYCLNNPIKFVDSNGDIVAEATTAATNWWNPLGWIAVTILAVECIVMAVKVVDIAYTAFNISPIYDEGEALKNTPAPLNDTTAKAETSNVATGSPRPPKNDKNKLSLKTISKQLLRKASLDAHAIKHEYLGNKANVALYDLAYDTRTGIIYIITKAGEIVEKTYYNLNDYLLMW